MLVCDAYFVEVILVEYNQAYTAMHHTVQDFKNEYS